MASILSLCEKVRVKMAKGNFVTETSETTTDRLSSTSTEKIGGLNCEHATEEENGDGGGGLEGDSKGGGSATHF